MAQGKPNCADFILAAARTIRMKPTNITPGTAAGVRIDRIWHIAKDAYTDAEFRKALIGLLADGQIMITARFRDTYGTYSDRRVDAFPKNVPAGRYSRWTVNGRGTYVKETEKNAQKLVLFRAIFLYIKADGLPKKAAVLEAHAGRPTTAHDIIAAMKT